MPLKSYTLFYPKRMITEEDEKKIDEWVDRLTALLPEHEQKYGIVDTSIADQTKKIFDAKCFRCHANGNRKGGFGGMEKMDDLLKSQFVDPHDPEASELYKIMKNKKMPPSKKDSLSDDELHIVREWLHLR